MITAIAAVSGNWGIGKGGDLLFHIPEDMKFFRMTTLNHNVIMGRKTLESFPNGKPLKNRTNIVLSQNPDFAPEDVVVCRSVGEAIGYMNQHDDEDFICGGGEIYKAFLPYCSKALITKVEATPEADTFFPNLDEDENWLLTEQSEVFEHEGIKFRFCTYTRK
ncbi:MAG: dihydrofolate reductase [Oscillospiraceae bacterium]|nr:dihydrofolate reductase [Oscillospiraceae bacterium]